MFVPFKKRQKVWLDTRNLKTNYHKKMMPKREGPFKIDKVLRPVTYRLKLPDTWRIHNVFHAVLLKPYQENKVYGKNFATPPLDIMDGEEVYQVKQSWNIEDKDEDSNTSSNGKDIQSPRPHGNWNQLSLMMICWMTTNNDINYEKVICQTTPYTTTG